MDSMDSMDFGWNIKWEHSLLYERLVSFEFFSRQISYWLAMARYVSLCPLSREIATLKPALNSPPPSREVGCPKLMRVERTPKLESQA